MSISPDGPTPGKFECQTARARVAHAVTVLFVPGDRPDRFAKAAASGADVVILDLEDAVAPEAKKYALDQVVRALSPRGDGGFSALVRTNGPSTVWFAREIATLAELALTAGNGVLGLVLPKAEEAADVETVRQQLPDDSSLLPLIESAIGVVNALQIARVPGVDRLAFGAVDFALDIDAGPDPRAMDHARSNLVLVSRAAGIAAPLDAPPTAIKNLESASSAAALGRSFGFGGSLCIHPAQVGPVRAAHQPTRAELEWAQKVLDVAGAGLAQVDGEMVDRPVIDRARRVVARAGKD